MGKNKHSFGNKISSFLRHQDSYGHPISLTFKKSPTYRSAFGGVFSLLSNFLIIAYFGYELSNVVNREQATITYSIYKRNLSIDQTTLKLTRDNFDFTAYPYFNSQAAPFNKTYTNSIQPNIDQYFNVFFTQMELTLPESSQTWNGSFTFHQTPLSTQKCGNNSFPKFKQDDTYNFKNIITDYYCPADNFTVELQGSFLSRVTKFVNVEFRHCTQQKLDQLHPGKNLTCKPWAEAVSLFPYMQFRIAIMSEYFDVKEYNVNPIKQNIRLLNYFQAQNTAQISTLKISQNYAILQDSKLASWFPSANYSFNDVKTDFSTNQYMDQEQNTLVTLQIQQDESVQTIERKAFTFFDAISNAGGLMGTIFAIINFLLSGVQEQLFLVSIMKRLFIYEKQQPHSIIDQNQSLIQLQPKNKALFNDKARPNKVMNLDTDKSQVDLNEKDANDPLNYDLLRSYLQSLKSCVFTYKEPLLFKIRSITRKCFKNCKHTHREQLYRTGKKRIEKEFDIAKILKSLRRVELLEQIILYKYQTFFFPYLKQNVLTDTSTHTYTKKQSKKDHLNSDQTKIYIHQLLNQGSERINARILENIGAQGKFIKNIIAFNKSAPNPEFTENANEEISSKIVAKTYNDYLQDQQQQVNNSF